MKIKLTIPPFSPLSIKKQTISTPKIEFKNELMSPITTRSRETYKKNLRNQEKPENCSVKSMIFWKNKKLLDVSNENFFESGRKWIFSNGFNYFKKYYRKILIKEKGSVMSILKKNHKNNKDAKVKKLFDYKKKIFIPLAYLLLY